MTFSGLLDRIDDWINPIVIKELRQAVKSRMVVSILMLFLGLQLFILALFLVFGEYQTDNRVQWNAGNEVFRVQQIILMITLMLLVPAYAAIRLATERSDHNVDLLFISTLRPRSIISGKLFAALVLAVLVFSTCAPFMTFTYLLRGIDIPTILTVLGLDLLAVLWCTMFALFVAAIPGPRAVKFFLAFLAFIFLGILCSYSCAATFALISEGASALDGMFDFWLVLAVFVAGMLGVVGQLFVYSVSMISPPSSNRILPVRVFLVVLLAGMATGLFLTSYHYKPSMHFGPIAFWVFGAALLTCVQFSISICERERWGPRVRKSIPRNPLVRAGAFFFWTGSAGGMALSVLLAVASLLGAWYWCEKFGGPTTARVRGEDITRYFLDIMVVICLYTYCYGLSAVLVRTYVLANQLKTSFTWLVGLLLVGLGSSVPSVFAYMFFQEQMTRGESLWWMLPNPIMAVNEITPGFFNGTANEAFHTLCLWFLGTWGVLVTVLSVPWFWAQIRRFHPPRDTAYAAVKMVGEEPVLQPPQPASSVGAG
jgi:hypothetical protein